MSGWIKLHREIFDSDIWHDVTTFRLFVFLIGKATYHDGIKVNGMELKKGQYVRSYRKLADDLAYKEGRGFKTYSLSTIKKCVNKLVESERVNVQETEVGTLFTIVNYAKYQDLIVEEKESANTLNEELRTNSELTANEVRTNCEQKEELKNLRIKELNISTTTTSQNYFDEYMLCFSGQPSPIQIQEINNFIDQDGMEVEVVCTAFKKAAEVGAKYPYARSILNNWASKGIRTIGDVNNEQATHEQRKQQQRQKTRKGSAPIRTEMLPDWFDEDNNKKPDKAKIIDVDVERKKRELNETLKKLRAGS